MKQIPEKIDLGSSLVKGIFDGAVPLDYSYAHAEDAVYDIVLEVDKGVVFDSMQMVCDNKMKSVIRVEGDSSGNCRKYKIGDFTSKFPLILCMANEKINPTIEIKNLRKKTFFSLVLLGSKFDCNCILYCIPSDLMCMILKIAFKMACQFKAVIKKKDIKLNYTVKKTLKNEIKNTHWCQLTESMYIVYNRLGVAWWPRSIHSPTLYTPSRQIPKFYFFE